MAIFSLSVEPYSRARGQSMIAKAAYRAGARLYDERTGQVADYRRRTGVEAAFLMFPAGIALEREDAWNRVEAAEKRKDARVGREILFALPCELSPQGRERCVRRFGQALIDRFDTFVDIALHRPNRKGDERNVHCHMLLPTRTISVAGLGQKLRDLDDLVAGPKLITSMRETWAAIANEELAAEGHLEQIDARSHRDRGIETRPSVKLGLAAISIERKTGQPSRKRQHVEAPIAVDENLLRAIVAYEADQAEVDRTGSGDRHRIDIATILRRLKQEASATIEKSLAERIRSRRRRSGGQPYAGRGTRLVYRAMTRSHGIVSLAGCTPIPNQTSVVASWTSSRLPEHQGFGRDLMADASMTAITSFEAPSKLVSAKIAPPKPGQPSGADLCKANGFVIAAASALFDAPELEIEDFVRWAIDLVANQFGLARADLAGAVGHFRSFAPQRLAELTGDLVHAVQRYVEAVGGLIAETKARRQIYPPIPGRKLYPAIDDDLENFLRVAKIARTGSDRDREPLKTVRAATMPVTNSASRKAPEYTDPAREIEQKPAVPVSSLGPAASLGPVLESPVQVSASAIKPQTASNEQKPEAPPSKVPEAAANRLVDVDGKSPPRKSPSPKTPKIPLRKKDGWERG